MGSYRILTGGGRFRAVLITRGIALGAAAGFVASLYRVFLGMAEKFSLAALGGTSPFPLAARAAAWCAGAWIIAKLMEREPLSRGGGIPQVEAELLGQLSMNPWRVLGTKFTGGGLAIAMGMSLGRGGPSVQIGAAVGKGAARLGRASPLEERFFLTCGAAAGISAVFNAPLAGVLFVLEEVHKSFSPLILLSAMTASLAADVVSKNFFGLGAFFPVAPHSSLPLGGYVHFLLLGILCGGGGALFCRVILAFQSLYAKLKISLFLKILIPALAALAVGPFLPQILGGGQLLVESIGRSAFSPEALLFLFSAKLLFTALCFGSGAPGGIFLPMLSLGAALGALYGSALSQFFGMDPALSVNFLFAGMAGFFAAVVRAPITGIVLITEMTGSFSQLLPVSVAALAAHAAADLLRSGPIYESLRKRLVTLWKEEEKGEGKVLLEGYICPGALLDGVEIQNAGLPEGCLFVNIFRSGEEILPRGDTVLRGGDRVTALADAHRAAGIKETLLRLAEISPPENGE